MAKIDRLLLIWNANPSSWPIVTLLFIVIIKLSILSLTNFGFSYDEFIVTEISKQPSSLLMDTILSEPHPALFYFSLKLLPVDYPYLTSIIVTIISSIFMFGVFVYGHNSDILKNKNISTAVCLFMISVNFFEMTTAVKVSALAFPILILIYFIIIAEINDSKYVSSRYIIISILCTFLALYSLIHFIFALIMVSCLYVFKPIKQVIYSALPSIVAFAAYSYGFGYLQHILNKERFMWIEYGSNNLVSFLFTHFLGVQLKPLLYLPITVF